MFFGYILPVLSWTLVISLFLPWQNTPSVNLNCLGYGGNVSGVPQGRDGRNSGFSFPFRVALLTLLYPKSSFPSCLSIPKVAVALPARLHFSSSLPLCTLSSHLVNLWGADEDQDKVQEHISHLKKILKVLICLKDEFLLFNNGQQAHQKEIGIDFLRILVLPCPMYNSLSCLKPLAWAWQMLQNLLLNTC